MVEEVATDVLVGVVQLVLTPGTIAGRDDTGHFCNADKIKKTH